VLHTADPIPAAESRLGSPCRLMVATAIRTTYPRVAPQLECFSTPCVVVETGPGDLHIWCTDIARALQTSAVRRRVVVILLASVIIESNKEWNCV